jgi:hypothetical protein
MYVSRISFHTLPGKTQQVEEKLLTLLHWVEQAGGTHPRVMRTHYGSPGAPDLIFEQEAEDLVRLEAQIKAVTQNGEFQKWAQEVSALLQHQSKRELYAVMPNSH